MFIFRVSLRSALVKEAKELDEYESSLNALPSDEEAMQRNTRIRRMTTANQEKTITNRDQLQVKRHLKLLDAYENMVQRESMISKQNKNL